MAGLTVEDLVHVARRSVGGQVRVRDPGLLAAALARQEAWAFGEEVYPTVEEKAGALLHSLATTVPLVEGNRPFALAATLVYLAQQGRPSVLSGEAAVELVTDICTGKLESVREVADRLRGGG
ncbi:Fic family protein [Modestobacter sp. NPDC049651]|uniref:type II toxin-antitoxin system death-on-curing family toxin n=1 Tax=unclassified Modestobacter TaxID=2643866 RepID=UPI00340B0A49